MGTFESSYKSLLQGVSQQIARERQPGQVAAQENMLSDVVTNIRRRPGAEYKFNMGAYMATASNIKACYTDIAGTNIHVIINSTTGNLTVLGTNYTVLASLSNTYFEAPDSSYLRTTTVGDELFILNTTKQPVASGGSVGDNPDRRGAFYIAAGAFAKEYSVTISTSIGTYTASYTTPTGSSAGDAALATPAYIAAQLYSGINTNSGVWGLGGLDRTDAYVYLVTTGTFLTVTSSTGAAFLVPSKNAYFLTEGSLPARLPAGANGWIVKTGDTRTPKYFAYNSTTTAWLECGDWASPTSITNMPIALTKVGTAWQLLGTAFEGRYAGDEASNPNPRFTTYPITGIGAYQGRLVLLSGPQVLLSASNKPRRFYRSTVTSILDSDCISVASSANSSAAYTYAVPFQKDLLLFSAKYQALIPSGNAAVTPRTATCVLTSSYNADMSSGPVMLGRTLMYPTPRSEDFFGVLEMIPSTQVDSQYTSTDATAHLPKYMGGRCRFSVSSSNTGMVLFAPSGDTKTLIVHEYIWDGDTKVQQAWHRWSFPYPIADAYFAGEVIIILFVNAGYMIGASIDPKVGVLTFASGRKPFLDLHSASTITANSVSIPTWLTTFDPTVKSKLMLTVRTGDLAGEKVGFIDGGGNTLKTVSSYATGNVSMGIPYSSAISPTQPVVKDANGVLISTGKTTLLRYTIGTANSSEYKVQVKDAQVTVNEDTTASTLYWSSSELSPGRAAYATESEAVVPCRTDTMTTTALFWTNGLGELNIVSIEYVLKFNIKIKRMEGVFK